jgi:hypothetical protein
MLSTGTPRWVPGNPNGRAARSAPGIISAAAPAEEWFLARETRLALFECAQLGAALGARIEAAGAAGRGTVFTVELPLGRANSPSSAGEGRQP